MSDARKALRGQRSGDGRDVKDVDEKDDSFFMSVENSNIKCSSSGPESVTRTVFKASSDVDSSRRGSMAHSSASRSSSSCVAGWIRDSGWKHARIPTFSCWRISGTLRRIASR